jgi:hypothetical protein
MGSMGIPCHFIDGIGAALGFDIHGGGLKLISCRYHRITVQKCQLAFFHPRISSREPSVQHTYTNRKCLVLQRPKKGEQAI